MAYSDENTILLSWEKVPFAKGYDIFKNGILYTDSIIDSTTFADSNVDTSIENTFEIRAYDENQKTIGKSFETKLHAISQPENKDLVMKFQLGNNSYFVNGQEQTQMNTAPIIKNGRTFLVIRHITDEVGAKISWDDVEKKVTIISKNAKTIELWIGKPVALVDGIETKIDSEDKEIVPIISEGRTLLPLRFVSDNLGATDTLWNAETKEIELIWSNFNKVYPYTFLKIENKLSGVVLTDQLGYEWSEAKYETIEKPFLKVEYRLSVIESENTIQFEPLNITQFENNKSFTGTVTSNAASELSIQSTTGGNRHFQIFSKAISLAFQKKQLLQYLLMKQKR
ncbi:MAG: copper amine oxidase N-terminal domain-containing protein [Caldisericia bacterium]